LPSFSAEKINHTGKKRTDLEKAGQEVWAANEAVGDGSPKRKRHEKEFF
jgi:hypothetical protein